MENPNSCRNWQDKYTMRVDSIKGNFDSIYISFSDVYYNAYWGGGNYVLYNNDSFDLNLFPNSIGNSSNNYYQNLLFSRNVHFLELGDNSLSYTYTGGYGDYSGFTLYTDNSGNSHKTDLCYSSIGLSNDTLSYLNCKSRHFTSRLGLVALEANGFESGSTTILYAYRLAGESTVTIIDQYYNDLIIGVDELETISFKLLGNPITNTLNIQLEIAEAHTLTLCNLSGQQLLQQFTNDTNASMDVSHLPSGMYLLEVKSANGTVGRQRVVKL